MAPIFICKHFLFLFLSYTKTIKSIFNSLAKNSNSFICSDQQIISNNDNFSCLIINHAYRVYLLVTLSLNSVH